MQIKTEYTYASGNTSITVVVETGCEHYPIHDTEKADHVAKLAEILGVTNLPTSDQEMDDLEEYFNGKR